MHFEVGPQRVNAERPHLAHVFIYTVLYVSQTRAPLPTDPQNKASRRNVEPA